jgi:hypothetical protein
MTITVDLPPTVLAIPNYPVLAIQHVRFILIPPCSIVYIFQEKLTFPVVGKGLAI